LAAISTARSFSSAGQWRLTIPVFSRIQASSMPSASICSKWALVIGSQGAEVGRRRVGDGARGGGRHR
jgi:hypothetical protein